MSETVMPTASTDWITCARAAVTGPAKPNASTSTNMRMPLPDAFRLTLFAPLLF